MNNLVKQEPQDVAPTSATEVATASDSIMDVIARAASDPGTDVSKLERLMDMAERLQTRQAKAAYFSALAEMQAEMPVIKEKGQGHNSITYARYEDIVETIKPVLAKFGFALSFRVGDTGDKMTVTGVLSHREGHSEETTMTLPFDGSGSKNAVQAVGSSTQYGKRYTANALLNLTSTKSQDDDGEAGGAGGKITDGQGEQILKLIEETGSDIEAFCKYMRVASVPDIPLTKFGGAIAKLDAKRSKKK